MRNENMINGKVHVRQSQKTHMIISEVSSSTLLSFCFFFVFFCDVPNGNVAMQGTVP